MNERTEITEHGLFWRQDNDQRKLWGTLRISETNEARLETFGSLIHFEERSAINIIGQIKGGFGWVTLINCFPVNTKNPVPIREGETDWSHQTLHVNQAVDGIAFEKGEEVAFEEAILDISTLSRWGDPRLVEAHLAKGDISPFRTDLSVREREDETAVLNFRGERIRVSIRFTPKGGSSREGVISRYSVEDHCTLVIETPDGTKLPLENFLSVTGSILNLLSICCNETPAVKEFLVRYEKQAVPPGRAFVRMRGHSVEQEKRRGSPSPELHPHRRSRGTGQVDQGGRDISALSGTSDFQLVQQGRIPRRQIRQDVHSGGGSDYKTGRSKQGKGEIQGIGTIYGTNGTRDFPTSRKPQSKTGQRESRT